MKGAGRPTRSQRGVALVVVLWGLVLLAIIAGSFAAGSRTETRMAFNSTENAKARALAEAGIRRAILGLLEPDNELRWRADQTPYQFVFGGGTVRLSIQDEGGRIDLNKGRDEHLKGLFELLGHDQDASDALVDAINDFRDPDDLRRLNGAEDRDYGAAGLSHEAKDAPFESVDELRLVMGMTRELYDKAAPFLTVYSKRPQVDLTTAPREVVQAVPGVDTVEADAIFEARANMTGAKPAAPLPMPVAARKAFRTSGSRIYTIRAEARTPTAALFVGEAVIRLTRRVDQPFERLEWKRGRRAPPAAPDQSGD